MLCLAAALFSVIIGYGCLIRTSHPSGSRLSRAAREPELMRSSGGRGSPTPGFQPQKKHRFIAMSILYSQVLWFLTNTSQLMAKAVISCISWQGTADQSGLMVLSHTPWYPTVPAIFMKPACPLYKEPGPS